MLVPDVLRKKVAAAPDRVAHEVDGAGSMTFAEWDRRASMLARRLVRSGVEPGDRIALRFSNRRALEYLVGYVGIQKAGAVVVPVNPRLAPPEVASVLDHSEARLVLSEPWDVLDRCLDRAEGTPRPAILEGRRWTGLEEPDGDGDLQVERSESDLADILYTSGTTGRPKGVASTHADVAGIGGRAVRPFEGQVFLHAFPYSTFAGTHGMMMLTLWGAMTCIVQPRFDASRFAELIERRRVALAYVAPAMLRLILEVPDLRRHDYGSLRLLLYGSAATAPEAVRRAAEVFPSALQVNVYGLTEGGGASCSLPPDEALRRPGSIGKPIPPAEVSVRDDAGVEVAPGVGGEIWLRLPGRRRSYYRDEEATARTWTADGWLRTGDLGHFDEDGFLYVDDRKKDVIIRGGHNVFPAEVEAALLEHPAVAEAAVVGVEHRVLGEDLKAFVKLRPGASADAGELRSFVGERLADYKTPRAYEFVGALPRNSMGKVLRRVLREGGAVGRG